ncbi:MAG: 16S rRNA (guanine(966)-N(2))-methyltransferase RsmD [Betaproteobacteria bacterium]|nr:16S rRNA (guanine(966)-N(2))-methyltransferase RsmD [Betaproteobacteria bacterium]
MSARVRIVGGTWRSRLIDVADIPGLRPTPDRVRETLFNWLGQTLDGLSCLDLFAGSGILGFEAASRGAATVMLVEQDPRAHAALRRNTEKLAATQVEIVRGDALEFLTSTTRQFNVAFADPPYRQGLIERIMPLLDKVMLPGGLVYAEAETPLDPFAGWHVFKRGRAGQVHFHLLERTTST